MACRPATIASGYGQSYLPHVSTSEVLYRLGFHPSGTSGESPGSCEVVA